MSVSLTLVATVFSLGLFCMKVAGQRDCSNLTVKLNNKTISSSDVCMAEFNKKECLPFVKSFNRSDLPDMFNPVSPAVEIPSGMDLVTLVGDRFDQDSNESYWYPGVRVQWKSPVSENARQDLEGFLLILKSERSTICRLFRTNTSSRCNDMLTFSYDVNNLWPATNYKVKVYSVPTPDPEYRDSPERFVSMTMTSFRVYSPALWTPSISIKTWPNGSLDVKFTRSPREFNFTNFEISLYDKSFALCRNITQTEEVFTPEDPEGKVTFSGLATGKYLIVVRPVDPFKLIEGKCYCWKLVEESFCLKERCCENNCESTETESFDLTVTETPSSLVTIGDHTVQTTLSQSIEMSSQLSSETLSSDEIIGIAFGSLSATLIVFVLLVVCLQRKHYLLLNALYLRWPCSSDETAALNKVSEFSDEQFTELPTRWPASLTTKKLYVMSADDHQYYVRMIEALANYLELHCRCQVIYPPAAEDLDKFDSPYSWFISHVTSSDRIVCVISPGAEKLAEARLAQMVYRDRQLRPEGDLFTECLKHIYKDNRARDKVINIFFGITEPEAKYITSPFTFGIPRNIPELVLKIHSLNSRRRDAHSAELPLLRESINSLPGGLELLSAIDQSEHYEIDNPSWLNQCFGEASRLTSTRQSQEMGSIPLGDSGIYDMGARSASTVLTPTSVDDACGVDEKTGRMDGASCVTVDEGRDVISDVHSSSIIPPDALSECVGSIGEAMTRINESNPPDGRSDVSGEAELVLFIPPDSMSDVNNVSEVFREINRLSDSAECTM